MLDIHDFQAWHQNFVDQLSTPQSQTKLAFEPWVTFRAEVCHLIIPPQTMLGSFCCSWHPAFQGGDTSNSTCSDLAHMSSARYESASNPALSCCGRGTETIVK